MGALRDFVARDPRTDAPAVVNFPVRDDNPYRIDVAATQELIARYRPELIVFGRSMVLHPEPVAEIRRFLTEQGIEAVVLYDMAHVLGLIGPHFQEPFADGADLVTGSTHKTFFGTQRGVVGSRFVEPEERYELWEALRRRAFPGSVSNHHLGTLLGLLFATYEMRAFRDAYQPRVIANAKAFARALAEAGLDVQGDPALDFTETHQVVLRVGYGRGHEMAARLEESNYLQLPGPARRRGLHRRRRPAPGRRRDDALRHGPRRLRRARRASGRRRLARRAGRRQGPRPAGTLRRAAVLLRRDELGDGLAGLAAFAVTGRVSRPRSVPPATPARRKEGCDGTRVRSAARARRRAPAGRRGAARGPPSSPPSRPSTSSTGRSARCCSTTCRPRGTRAARSRPGASRRRCCSTGSTTTWPTPSATTPTCSGTRPATRPWASTPCGRCATRSPASPPPSCCRPSARAACA